MKDITLTPYQIFELLPELLRKYELQSKYKTFEDYVDYNSEIVVNGNSAFHSATMMMAEDQYSDIITYNEDY